MLILKVFEFSICIMKLAGLQEVRVDDLLITSNCSIMVLGCVLMLQKKREDSTMDSGRCILTEESKSVKCVQHNSPVATGLL